MARKNFTKDEVVAAMHRERELTATMVADFVEKYKIPYTEVVKLLREIAEQAEMAIIDIEMQNSKGFSVERKTTNELFEDVLKKNK